ncbi:hypothetical protein [Umezawaea sp. NPDC059074]|uniref:hypothetical protein n=1 Tax=Umezawaea sp. NPDC059074 TaxID=3346716 RepID=UPI0036741777
MSDPVVIGIREVYDEVVKLRGRFDESTTKDAVRAALLEARVDRMERERADERAEREKERAAEVARRWAVYVALIGALVAVVMGVLQIVTK